MSVGDAAPARRRPSPVAADPCPRCGEPQRGGDGWPRWCAACDHGVVESVPPAPPGRWQRWRDERRRRTDDALVAEVSAGQAGAGLGLSFVIAGFVHLLTLACLAGGVWLVITTWFEPITVLALVLVAIGVTVAPRIPRRSHVLPPTAVPLFAAQVEAVAAAVGCPVPDAYVVDDRFNAAVSRVLGPQLRPMTVLHVGRPLWASITQQERVALLAHELGHATAGDPGRSWFVHGAQRSLREWSYILLPATSPALRRRYQSHRQAANTTFAELIAALILAPLSALVSALTAAYTRVVNRRHRRCELLADRTAVTVAGDAATRRLLTTLLLEDVVRVGVSSARARGETAPTTLLAAQAVVRVPDDERERRIRREQLLGDTGDSTHPPTYRRIALVEAMPGAPAIEVPADVAAVNAELARAR